MSNLALEVDTSLASRRVTCVLDRTIGKYGKPQAIRCDHGPALTSGHFLAWAIENKIDLLHSGPGKSTENACVESFHGRLRDECLNVSWFCNLFDARRKISAWQPDSLPSAHTLRSATGGLKSSPISGCSAGQNQTSPRKKQKKTTLRFQSPKWTDNRSGDAAAFSVAPEIQDDLQKAKPRVGRH